MTIGPPVQSTPQPETSRRGTAEQADSARQILLTVFCTLLTFLAVGMPLAVLPPWVDHDLGFSAVIAGLAVSSQYAATVVSRAMVGPMADTAGPRRSILLGFGCCMVSGVLLFGASLLQAKPFAALTVMFMSRIALGFCESWVSTSAIAWAIGRTGPGQTARIISWNGIATYGGIGAGAPIGVWLVHQGGIGAIGAAVAVLGLFGFLFTLPQAPTATIAEARLPFRTVFLRVAPHGMVLGAGAIGFGVIAAFVTLFYADRGWDGAWVALTLFGAAFILSRLLFLNSVARYGGLTVTGLSLSVELLGLSLLWIAPNPLVADLGAALTGFGFAMVFPALGVIVVDLVPAQNRGAAIGAFSMFTDIALGLTGPVAGVLATDVGYATPFLFGALAIIAGLVLIAWIVSRSGRTAAA